jgi:hypothetical protein
LWGNIGRRFPPITGPYPKCRYINKPAHRHARLLPGFLLSANGKSTTRPSFASFDNNTQLIYKPSYPY